MPKLPQSTMAFKPRRMLDGFISSLSTTFTGAVNGSTPWAALAAAGRFFHFDFCHGLLSFRDDRNDLAPRGLSRLLKNRNVKPAIMGSAQPEASARMSDPTIFISAGEASGEHYGALLIQALQEPPGARRPHGPLLRHGRPRAWPPLVSNASCVLKIWRSWASPKWFATCPASIADSVS